MPAAKLTTCDTTSTEIIMWCSGIGRGTHYSNGSAAKACMAASDHFRYHRHAYYVCTCGPPAQRHTRSCHAVKGTKGTESSDLGWCFKGWPGACEVHSIVQFHILFLGALVQNLPTSSLRGSLNTSRSHLAQLGVVGVDQTRESRSICHTSRKPAGTGGIYLVPIGSFGPTNGWQPWKLIWSVTETNWPGPTSGRREPTAVVIINTSQPIPFKVYTGHLTWQQPQFSSC